MNTSVTEKKYSLWIWVLSITVPLVVALLFSVNLQQLGYHVQPLSFLPPIYAGINALTAVLLVLAIRAIRQKNAKKHQLLIKICMGCSLAFLAMYVAYHMTSIETKYGGEGILKYIYFFILITHIMLSVIIIPFVLFTFVRGIAGAYQRHKKLARITYPMWLYVAVTGVIVYLMISPYYK